MTTCHHNCRQGRDCSCRPHDATDQAIGQLCSVLQCLGVLMLAIAIGLICA